MDPVKPAEWRNAKKPMHLLSLEARDNQDINTSVEPNKAQTSILRGFLICS